MSIRVFTDRDGLPQDTIQALTLDARGYLWVGTQDGPAYYDGRRWSAIGFPERAREDNFVRCVLGTEDGSVWFGTRSNGLYRLKDERWTWYRDAFVGTGHARVNALMTTRTAGGDWRLWVATDKGGVARFDGGRWLWFTTADGLPSDRVWGLGQTTDRDGNPVVWAGTGSGVACLRAGSRRFERAEGIPGYSFNCFLVTRDPRSGRQVLWAGSYGHGLYRLEGGRWTRLSRKQGLGSDFVTSLAASTAGDGRTVIWVGTDGGGVARLLDGAVRVFGMRDGLPSNAAYSLLTTTTAQGADALWIGMRNGGLARLMEGKWQRVWPEHVERNVPILAMASSSGRRGCPEYWLGTDGNGLYHWADGVWSKVAGLGNRTVECLLAAPEGTVWAGTRTAGLARIRGDTVQWYSTRSSDIGCDMIQALAATSRADGHRRLWVGTRRGIFTMQHGVLDRAALPEDAASQSVTALLPCRDAQGQPVLWAGIGGRLARRDRSGWTFFEPGHLYQGWVQCLMLQKTPSGERLWVGTDGAGISVLQLAATPRQLFALRASDPPLISNDVVYWIGEDRDRRVYILTNRGVTRLSSTVKDPRGPHDFTVTTFTAEDGLPSNQGNRGAGLLSPSGRIFVGTIGGCALLDPRLVQPDRIAKKLDLTAHLLGERDLLVHRGCRLAYNQKHIRFDATLLCLFRGDETRYRFQLVGIDTAPSHWRRSGWMEYQNLGPGRYVFRAWGRDYAGNVSGPVEFAFRVLPAPWQTWWARGLGLLLLIGLVWGISHLRSRSARIREQRAAQLVETRTRELQEVNARLAELARMDSLTGLGNRRAFDESLNTEWERMQRTGRSLALILVDIDGFKGLNDRHGHSAGDLYLRELGAVLTMVAQRATDIAARIGGDEFAVLLPHTSPEWASALAEAIRAGIADAGKQAAVGKKNWPTVSCGVAGSTPEVSSAQELLEWADRCLYEAKRAGGNRVVTLSDLDESD